MCAHCKRHFRSERLVTCLVNCKCGCPLRNNVWFLDWSGPTMRIIDFDSLVDMVRLGPDSKS